MYQASWTNKRRERNNAFATVILVDDASVYPTVTQDFKFVGLTVAQLTNALLNQTAKKLMAQTIQDYIVRQNDARLQQIKSDFEANLQALIASMRVKAGRKVIRANPIEQAIKQAWQDYNCASALANPTVTVDENVRVSN